MLALRLATAKRGTRLDVRNRRQKKLATWRIRPIDAKAAERCASIVGAKQKGDEPPPSHVSLTDVAVVVPANYDTLAGSWGVKRGITRR